MKTHNQGKDTKGYQKKERGRQKRQRFTVGRQNPDNRIKRHEGRVRGKKGSEPEETERGVWAFIPWKSCCARGGCAEGQANMPSSDELVLSDEAKQTEICTVYDNPSSGASHWTMTFPYLLSNSAFGDLAGYICWRCATFFFLLCECALSRHISLI